MTLLTKILLKRINRQKKYFLAPFKYASYIKKATVQILPRVRVFLFGSILSGEALPSSDIDILVYSPSLPKSQSEQAKIKTKIFDKIGPSAPFEIHLIGKEGLSWYDRFIREKIEI